MSYLKPPSNMAKKKRWKKRPKPYNAPKSEDLETVLGRWKVTKVLYEGYPGRLSSDDDEVDKLEDGNREVYLPECEGVEVMFDDQCDITWFVPKSVEPIPLFLTTSFNIERDSVDFIGGEDGKTFRFLLENGATENSQIILKTPIDASYEEEETGEMVIVIDKVSNSSAMVIGNFSLKDALEDGFFSDLTIHSSDGISFPVHRIVLACSSPKMSYREWEVLLSGYKAPLVRVILEYLYTDSFPQNISLFLAKELSTVISTIPKLTHLYELSKTFIESNNLKQRLMGLVDDLQSSLVLAKRIVENTEAANPVKVTYTIKTLAKEAASGAAKLGLLCELYTRNKIDMSKREKHELLEYVRGRVVMFLDLVNELIQLAIAKFNGLTDTQKMEIGIYIIPEVERIWDIINDISKEVEAAMVAKVKSLYMKGKPHFRKQDIKIAFILQFISKGRELKRLQKIGEEFKDFVIHSHRKRDEFREWAEVEKAEKIIRVMEGMEGEGINQIEQLTDLKKDILMENALDWKRFKILVTVCCSYVSWGIRKAQTLRTPLHPLLLKGCKYIHKSDFNNALVYFDLLDQTDLEELQDDDQETAKVVMPGIKAASVSTENLLVKGCQKLLTSQEYTDMEFIVMPSSLPVPTSRSTSSDGGDGGDGGSKDGDKSVVNTGAGQVIHTHRVIVAARCEYFKRALQSGMKEAIDKCIVIHGCEESVFRTFLYYLYGGMLDTTTMSLDDIIELLTVADRYETTSLRTMCEGLLVERVEDGSVFSLLQVADHYSARQLREATMQHIIADPNVLMTEIEAYSNLPDDLKDEIRSILSSNNPHLALRHQPYPGGLHGIPNLRSDSASTASSTSSSRDSSSSSHISALNSSELIDSFSQHLEDAYHSDEHVAFQAALKELKAIVGEDASDDVLKDILLAADMDINRAVNFYFS